MMASSSAVGASARSDAAAKAGLASASVSGYGRDGALITGWSGATGRGAG